MKLNKVLRIYYAVAVVVLILITSAGIYGFLSNAFQQSAFDVESTTSQVQLYEGQKSALEDDITRFQDRINILNQQRTTQQDQYKELTDGEDWVNASRVFQQIERSDSTIAVLNDQISEKRQEMVQIDSLLFAARAVTLNTEREIGGFRFIAENFNAETSDVVKWFIFIIIFVFDPLAVSLVVGYNIVTYHVKDDQPKPEKPKKRKKEKSPEPIVVEEVTMDEFEEIIEEELDKPDSQVLSYMEYTVHNPYSNGKITVAEAMNLPDDHPAKLAAAKLLAGFTHDKLRGNNT